MLISSLTTPIRTHALTEPVSGPGGVALIGPGPWDCPGASAGAGRGVDDGVSRPTAAALQPDVQQAPRETARRGSAWRAATVAANPTRMRAVGSALRSAMAAAPCAHSSGGEAARMGRSDLRTP